MQIFCKIDIKKRKRLQHIITTFTQEVNDNIDIPTVYASLVRKLQEMTMVAKAATIFLNL